MNGPAAFHPERVDTRALSQPALYDGHLTADCSFRLDGDYACPQCLLVALRKYPLPKERE